MAESQLDKQSIEDFVQLMQRASVKLNVLQESLNTVNNHLGLITCTMIICDINDSNTILSTETWSRDVDEPNADPRKAFSKKDVKQLLLLRFNSNAKLVQSLTGKANVTHEERQKKKHQKLKGVKLTSLPTLQEAFPALKGELTDVNTVIKELSTISTSRSTIIIIDTEGLPCVRLLSFKIRGASTDILRSVWLNGPGNKDFYTLADALNAFCLTNAVPGFYWGGNEGVTFPNFIDVQKLYQATKTKDAENTLKLCTAFNNVQQFLYGKETVSYQKDTETLAVWIAFPSMEKKCPKDPSPNFWKDTFNHTPIITFCEADVLATETVLDYIQNLENGSVS